LVFVLSAAGKFSFQGSRNFIDDFNEKHSGLFSLFFKFINLFVMGKDQILGSFHSFLIFGNLRLTSTLYIISNGTEQLGWILINTDSWGNALKLNSFLLKKSKSLRGPFLESKVCVMLLVKKNFFRNFLVWKSGIFFRKSRNV